uniref:Ferritin n=1 Tax=Pan paniscus TaxID=9597 RepID=A0A2R9CKR6_PANPA
MRTTSTSQVRQNYHQDSEAAINRQINLELCASYVYLSMSYYFDRDDVALKNFAKYFLHRSHEEREHAEKLMKLQNQRGGRIFLQDIKEPDFPCGWAGLRIMAEGKKEQVMPFIDGGRQRRSLCRELLFLKPSDLVRLIHSQEMNLHP